MKRYKIICLGVTVFGCSLLPSTAWDGSRNINGVVTAGRGGTGSAVSITVPGYGNGTPALVAARANLNRGSFSGNRRGTFNTNVTDFNGIVTAGRGGTGSAVAITVPGYGNGNPALVAASANLSGRSSFSNDRFSDRGSFGGRGDRGGRGNNDGNGDNGTVVVVNSDNGNNGWTNYNNSNYLGLPPWYRLNYYTPWMSDYENGTAYQNIPTSHAWRGYGVPDDYPGATSYNGPLPPQGAPAEYQQAASANVDFVVGVQRELRRRGFYRGLVNGISDAPTRAAIRAYETSMGLPVTGVIGVPLLRTLGF